MPILRTAILVDRNYKQQILLGNMENNKLSNSNQDFISYAHQQILRKIEQKTIDCGFQDHWTEYEESYGTDYNDCHGDYYDAE